MTSNQSAIGQQVSHVNNNYPKLKGEREWDGTQGDFFFFLSLNSIKINTISQMSLFVEEKA